MHIEHGTHVSQMITLDDIGEMVPLTNAAYERSWEKITDVIGFHAMMFNKYKDEYYITVNGMDLPARIKNVIEFKEWYENDVQPST